MNSIGYERSPDEIQDYRSLLCRLFPDGTKRVNFLQVGAYLGSDTAALIEFARERDIQLALNVVDPWENGYDSKDACSYEVDMETVYQEFMRRFGSLSFVKVYRQTFLEYFLNARKRNPLLFCPDVIYLDGDHRPNSVALDFLCAQHLVHPCGAIAGHDYVPTKGDPMIWDGLKELIDKLHLCFPRRRLAVFGSEWVML